MIFIDKLLELNIFEKDAEVYEFNILFFLIVSDFADDFSQLNY